MNTEEFIKRQSPWSTLGRILTDAEWEASKAWRKTREKEGKFSIGDIAPDGAVFLGYERNYQGAEVWGTADALEVKRMRWRTSRRRALLCPLRRAAFNQKRKTERQTNPEVLARDKERQAEWRKNNRAKKTAADRRRDAHKLAAVHPDSDIRKECDFYTVARRLTRSTGKKHVVDHIIPLSVGGFHHHENLQVIPDSLNAQKRDDPLWTSDIYRDWRSVPVHLWPSQLAPVYAEKLKQLGNPVALVAVDGRAELLAALEAAEKAADFHLTIYQSLANHMDDPTGLAIIYESADRCGQDLAAIRSALAKAKGTT